MVAAVERQSGVERSRAAGWREAWLARLARLAPAAAWRDVAAALSGFMVGVALSGGILQPLPQAQAGIAVGIAVALVAATPARSAFIAAGVAFVAALVLPAWFYWGAPALVVMVSAATTALVAALVASALAWAVQRWPRRASRIGFGIASLLIIANLWIATSVLAQTPGEEPSLVDQLRSTPAAGIDIADDAFYIRVRALMQQGEGYYQAYTQAYVENARWGSAPPSPFAVRLPTFFWFWNALPTSSALVVAMALAASMAVAASAAIASSTVRLPLALPGMASLASYYLYWATKSNITYTEPWAALAALASLACIARWTRSRSGAWYAGAVAFALAAALTRELFAFLPFAGLLSAVIFRETRSRARASIWLAAIVAMVAAYSVHWWATGAASAHGGLPSWFGRGGLGNLLGGLSYGTLFLGSTVGFVWLVVVLGVAALPWFRDAEQRTYTVIAVSVPAVAFILMGNGAVNGITGQTLNYWGATLTPLLIAVSPGAFAALPGLAVPAPPGLRATS
jgi:hypothetical protein